jgi:phage terminase large subunit GpA-like protein
MSRFESLEEMIVATAEAVRPPERLTVAEAAEKYRYLNNPGSYVGPFRMSATPYLREPMEMLTSLDFTQLSFVGPAQCAKSDMASSWLTYSVVCDPADFMHIDKSQTSARDWHQRRNEKLFRDTPAIKERMMPGAHNSSTYSTRFTSGMLFTMSWPTVNELSGKPIGRLWLADYDRMDEDIGGEGSAFDLAVQRMKTFGRFGMCAAESSPSRITENSRWSPSTPHEAPPTTGILALYNRGDRRRWYWPCLSCGTPFEPCFKLFEWPDCGDDLLAAAEQVVMPCPHCGHQYRDGHHDESNTPGKRGMNMRGFWMKDGETFDKETGEIVGTAARSRMASFWLKGPAAAFADWTDMTLKYLKAVEEFEKTGSEESLKTTVNTDQGLPYLPAGIEAERLPEELKARAQLSLGEKVVPEGVRFLVATVDVQKRRFEVQIHGIKAHGDVVVIDRFKIRKSERVDEDGDPLPLNPGSYVEDWHLLIDKVLEPTYDLIDGSGRHMKVRMMAVDSGGSAGVTANAYEFWRQLRSDPEGRNYHRRVQLLKGEAKPSAPLVRIDYPNAERKDRKAQARGEVPVMMINVNAGKDMVNNMLGRTDPGGGMVFFPDWLPDWWYVELCAETKTAKGWVNPGAQRNEAWDLLVYCMALCHSSRIRLHHIDWENPPSWAAEWDENDMVGSSTNFRFENQPKSEYKLRDLAEKLG